MKLNNHHTHTIYSDGAETPEAYIVEAIKRGFDTLGFSEHSPLPFENTFSFQEKNRDEYLRLIGELKSKYAPQISIFNAMEIDYVPAMSENFAQLRQYFRLDYVIGSVHLINPGNSNELWFTDGPDYRIYDRGIQELFGGDIRKAVTQYYRQVNAMITTQQFEIIGHFDKIKMHNRDRFFSESEKWYTGLVNETINLIREKQLIVEVNTRGIYKKRSDTTYPGLDILKRLKLLDIRVMVNSDAHRPDELDGAYPEAFSLLKAAGIKNTVYFTGNNWAEQPIS